MRAVFIFFCFVLGLVAGRHLPPEPRPSPSKSSPVVIIIEESRSSLLEEAAAELADRLRWLRLTCNAEELAGEKDDPNASTSK